MNVANAALVSSAFALRSWSTSENTEGNDEAVYCDKSDKDDEILSATMVTTCLVPDWNASIDRGSKLMQNLIFINSGSFRELYH